MLASFLVMGGCGLYSCSARPYPPDLRTCDYARTLKEIALARWGYVDLERRQGEEGHRFWYNAYWKTKPARWNEASGPPAVSRPEEA